MQALARAAASVLRAPPPAFAPAHAPVWVRSVHAGDEPLLDRFVRALSPASRYARFHAGVRELSAVQLERITHYDRGRELSLVAVERDADGREVALGEARYAPSYEDGDAARREFGLAVADTARGRGIGTRLLRALESHAARRGVQLLTGDVVRDNLPMLALARRLGYEVLRHPDDLRLQRVQKRLEPHWRM